MEAKAGYNTRSRAWELESRTTDLSAAARVKYPSALAEKTLPIKTWYRLSKNTLTKPDESIRDPKPNISWSEANLKISAGRQSQISQRAPTPNRTLLSVWRAKLQTPQPRYAAAIASAPAAQVAKRFA
jgi:hypothetical protein